LRGAHAAVGDPFLPAQDFAFLSIDHAEHLIVLAFFGPGRNLLALRLFEEVHKELDDSSFVVCQMPLETHD
jgi:hypothetical protein